MKKQSLLLAAGLAFALSACDKKAADAVHKPADAASPASTESAAARTVPKVDPKVAFQDGLNALAGDIDAATKEVKESGNPQQMLKSMAVIMEKAQAVPTTGLSGELKAAYDEFLAGSGDVFKAMQGMPADTASPDAAKAREQIRPKLEEASARADAAKDKLKIAAEKEGIDVGKFLNAGQ